jgi:hypothetical protein
MWISGDSSYPLNKNFLLLWPLDSSVAPLSDFKLLIYDDFNESNCFFGDSLIET